MPSICLGVDSMTITVDSSEPWTSVESYAHVAADAMERIKDTMTAAALPFTVALAGT